MTQIKTPSDLSTLLALLDDTVGAPTAADGITAVLAGDGIAASQAGTAVTVSLDLASYSSLETAVLAVASSQPGPAQRLLKTDAAGRLFLEELVLAGSFSLVDEATGDLYSLAVKNGRLYLRPI